jgi:uncharacterized protein (TIGR02266 family)
MVEQPASTQPESEPLPLHRSPTALEPRYFGRTELTIDVTLEGDNNFFVGASENISEGGLFVATDVLAEVGARVSMDFGLPGLERRVACEGEVVWVRGAGRLPAGIGLRFVGLSREDAVEIRRFVEQRDPIFWE